MSNDCTNNKTDEGTRKSCEILIVKTLNDFNTNFQKYQGAYSSYEGNKNPGTASALNTEYTEMSKQLELIKTYVDKYTTKFLTNDGTNTNSQKFYKEIIEKYNKMIEDRKKLDQQLYDLYTNDYESVYSNKPFVDSTVVTGIIWTILVTFMLYYVIVKM